TGSGRRSGRAGPVSASACGRARGTVPAHGGCPGACEEVRWGSSACRPWSRLMMLSKTLGGFGETSQGGWGNPYFTEEAQQDAYEHLMASDYFLCGRVTYELLSKTWGKIKGGPYLDRMNNIPKLVASRTLTEPLEWNATLIKGDVPGAIAKLKVEGKNIEMYGSADLMQTLIENDLIDEYRIWVHPFVIGG